MHEVDAIASLVALAALLARRSRAPPRRRTARSSTGPVYNLHQVAVGQPALRRLALQLHHRARRGLRRQRPGHRVRAASSTSKLSSKVEVSGRIKSRFNQNFSGPTSAASAAAARARPAPATASAATAASSTRARPVHQAARRHRAAHAGLQLARLGARSAPATGACSTPSPSARSATSTATTAQGLLFQGSLADRQVQLRPRPHLAAAAVGGPELQHRRLHAPGRGLRRAGHATRPSSTVRPRAASSSTSTTSRSTRDRLQPGRRPRHRRRRFRNTVVGAQGRPRTRAPWSTSRRLLLRTSNSHSVDGLTPGGFGISGFSPTLAGKLDDDTCMALNVDLNDPFDIGLSFNIEDFNIGAEYVSMMAARRESDVLLTEGHDGDLRLPGSVQRRLRRVRRQPVDDRLRRLAGQRPAGGDHQRRQRVHRLRRADGRDRDRLEGLHRRPDLGDRRPRARRPSTPRSTTTPTGRHGGDARPADRPVAVPRPREPTPASARSATPTRPFQDKETDIYLLKAKYFLDVGNGLEVCGKLKWIDESDKRHQRRPLPALPAG